MLQGLSMQHFKGLLDLIYIIQFFPGKELDLFGIDFFPVAIYDSRLAARHLVIYFDILNLIVASEMTV